MPIEIKELNVKITVGEQGTQSSNQSTDATGNMDEIIEACIERVMEILANKEER